MARDLQKRNAKGMEGKRRKEVKRSKRSGCSNSR